MLQAILHSTTLPNGNPGFTVTSYGNGTAYCLRDRDGKRELFVQDSDAAEFQADMQEAIDKLGLNDGLAYVADIYGAAFTPDEDC